MAEKREKFLGGGVFSEIFSAAAFSRKFLGGGGIPKRRQKVPLTAAEGSKSGICFGKRFIR